MCGAVPHHILICERVSHSQALRKLHPVSSPVAGVKLYAQNFEGYRAAVVAACVAVEAHDPTDVASCETVGSLSNSAACDLKAECRYIHARPGSAGAWEAGARSSSNLTEAPDVSDNDLVVSRIAQITIDGTVYSALDVTTLWNDTVDTIPPHGPLSTGAKVPYLREATKYRFAIAFENEAGVGASSGWSTEVTTLERPITHLRILSGPPCVYRTSTHGATADPTPVTFAAQASGTNIRYRWELVYKNDAGLGALNAPMGTRAVSFTANNTFAAIAGETWAAGQTVTIAKSDGVGLNCDAAGEYSYPPTPRRFW